MTLIIPKKKENKNVVILENNPGNKIKESCHRNNKCCHSLFETDKAPGAVVLQADDRPQGAADLWFAGRLPPGVTEWKFVCSFHEGPVLWVAGRAPGAAEGQPAQEDCRSSERWK